MGATAMPLVGANAVRLQAPLNRGCGESDFVTINPGDVGLEKRPAVNDTASSWEETHHAWH
jgi:hypothetical protein